MLLQGGPSWLVGLLACHVPPVVTVGVGVGFWETLVQAVSTRWVTMVGFRAALIATSVVIATSSLVTMSRLLVVPLVPVVLLLAIISVPVTLPLLAGARAGPTLSGGLERLPLSLRDSRPEGGIHGFQVSGICVDRERQSVLGLHQ
jgi:hypothetical protein